MNLTDSAPREPVQPNQPNDEYWMSRALDLADRAAEQGEVPVGAVLVKDGVLIGSGWNKPISSCDPSAHAEIMALRDAACNFQNYRLPGTTLYVTIEPCAMCAGALLHARVSKLVFGATEPRNGAVTSQMNILDSSALTHKIQWQGGVLEQASRERMQAFFKERRSG